MASKEETIESIKYYALLVVLTWLTISLTFWRLVPESYWIAKRVTFANESNWTDLIVPKWSTVIKFDVSGLSHCITTNHEGNQFYNTANLIIQFWHQEFADQQAVLRMLEVYVNSDCDINAIDPSNQSSPIHQAIRQNDVRLVETVLNLGASLSLTTKMPEASKPFNALGYAQHLNKNEGFNNHDILSLLQSQPH